MLVCFSTSDFMYHTHCPRSNCLTLLLLTPRMRKYKHFAVSVMSNKCAHLYPIYGLYFCKYVDASCISFYAFHAGRSADCPLHV